MMQERHSAPGGREFDGSENGTNAITALRGQDDEVDVLGHENIGPQIKIMFALRGDDGVSKPLTNARPQKKRLAEVTGEG